MSEAILADAESETRMNVDLTPAQLIESALARGEGVLADNKALCVQTGKRTGRSPRDRFIVKDDTTQETVDWGEVNQPIGAEQFASLGTCCRLSQSA